MHRNPVKRGLVTTREEWRWSSFRMYACGEEGLVRVNCQEWPLRITCSASWGTRPASRQLIHFLFQLPNPLLQELPLWFLLGQGQSFLIRGPSLSCPAEPAVHIRTG